MGGYTPPEGYTYQDSHTYASNVFINGNSYNVKNNVKDGYIYPSITVIDSRGFSSKTIKKIAISFFKPAELLTYEAIRENGLDSKVRFKATGKIKDGDNDETLAYIKYTVSTDKWTSYNNTSGTKYGPFNVNLTDGSIIYDTSQSFNVNCLLQGDLGANGFTKGKNFYLQIEVASNVSQFGPRVYFTTVQNGNILMSIGSKGVAFGQDYDENEGGSVQGLGKYKALFSGTSAKATGLNSTVTVTLSESYMNYDFVYVLIGNGGNEVTNVIFDIKNDYKAGQYFCESLSNYYANGYINLLNNNQISFNVRQVVGWNYDIIKIYRVIGIKVGD